MKYETKIDVPNIFWLIAFVLLTIPISGACVDIFSPSLPSIQHYFNVNKDLVQLSVSLFLFGYGLGQIPFGVFSDRYGRRYFLLYGSLVFMVSTFLVTRSVNIYLLICMRFIEGISIACLVGVARTIIPDVFIGRDYHKISTYSNIAWGVGPIIAPFIGGYLQHYFGWQAPFYFLMGYGFIIFLIVLLILPETNLNPHRIDATTVVLRMKVALRHHAFIGGIILCGLLFSIIITFNIIAPFLIQTLLAKTAVYYGRIALIMGAAFFLGSIISRFLLHIPLLKKVKSGILFILLICLILMVIVLTGTLSIWTIALPSGAIFLIIGFIYPNIYGRTLLIFSDFTGLASCLFGSLLIVITAVISSVVSLLYVQNQLPMAGMWLLIALLLLIAYLTLFSKNENVKPNC